MTIPSGSFNFGVNNNKPVEKKEFNELLNKITKDGIVTPEERKEIFDTGLKTKDKPAFEELKQGIATDYPDIAAAFDEGHEAGTKSEGLYKSVEDIQEKNNYQSLRNSELKNQNIGRKAAASLEGAAKFASNLLHEIANPDEKNNVIKSAIKKAVFATGNGLSSLGSKMQDLSLPDAAEKNIAQKAKSEAKESAQQNVEKFVGKKEVKALSSYEKKEADPGTCLPDALKAMGYGDLEKPREGTFSEKTIGKMTGKNWDPIDYSKADSKELKAMISDAKNQALVVDGGHAYVYKGMDDQGNLKVYDATGDKNKTIYKTNVAATVYVQGKGDGDDSGMADGNKNVQSFKNINSLSSINSVDRTNGKLNESWQIRKLLVVMGDPAQASTVKTIASAIKLNDNDKLGKELNKLGIKLDDREIKAMATVLNSRIKDENGKSISMIDKFAGLNKSASGNLTDKQTKYLTSIEYSNVDLNNYFSSTGKPAEKAQEMYKTLQDIIEHGIPGC